MENYTEDDLKYFVNHIYSNNYKNNNGGMGAPDLFTLWYILNKYKPKIVIESGVWNGISTHLIRKTLPDSQIICIDPRNVPSYGYIDNNDKTTYLTGNKFIDFGMLDVSTYNTDDILCFFDCHQNAYLRIMQCINKNIKKIFFNDNYPVNCGSHYTIEHLKHDDDRFFCIDDSYKKDLINKIKIYHIFPNIFPGKIKTGEGYFSCNSFYKDTSDCNIDYNNSLSILKEERNSYRWNTFVYLI